jgi:hypothetical protein
MEGKAIDRTVSNDLSGDRSSNMHQTNRSGEILDHSGNPISKCEDRLEDLNLPSGVQALIETRINSAVDQLRENNRSDLRQLTDERMHKWWRVTGAVAVALLVSLVGNFFTWYVAPEKIGKMVQDYVEVHVAEPAMKQTLSSAAQAAADAYVKTKFDPLKASADELDADIKRLKDDIATKQASLAKEQLSVREQVRLQGLAVRAKMGDPDSYADLRRMANSNSDAAGNAQVFLKDVEQFYTDDRYSLVQKVPAEDGVRVQISVDEAILRLGSGDPEGRSAAANALNDLNRRSSVEALCELLAKENDLMVISRITRALETITKEKFAAEEKEKALAWWKQNRTNKEFQFPTAALVSGEAFFSTQPDSNRADFSVVINPDLAKSAIPLLRSVISAEPNSYCARFLLVLAQVGVGDLSSADASLSEFEGLQPTYRYISIAKGAVLMAHLKPDQAAESLAAGFKEYPSTASTAKQFAIFSSLAKDPKVTWEKQKD